MSNFSPITYAQTYSLSGFESSVLSTTTIACYNGLCLSNDNRNMISIQNSAGYTVLNMATVGLNGIDTGAIGASKQYALYAIADSSGVNPSGFILSLSLTGAFTAPSPSTLGGSYDSFRLIGYYLSNSSSQLISQSVVGDGVMKDSIYVNGILVLNAGTSATLVSIDLSAAIPSIPAVTFSNNITQYNATVSFTPATSADYVIIVPASTTATAVTTYNRISGVVAAKAQVNNMALQGSLVTGSPSTMQSAYITSAASGSTSIWVQSYQFSTRI